MNGVRFIIRLVIVIGITGLLFCFLQFPQFLQLFQSQRSINVLAWPNVIDAEYFDQFERETCINV